MNMPLVLLNRRRRGFTAFSPSTLFALAEPGVWYDPSDVANLAWRRNLLTYSEQFNVSAVWGVAGVSVTANSTPAPNGTSTAETLTRTSTDALQAMVRADTLQAVNATYTLSVYAKINTTGAQLYVRNIAVDGSTTTGVVHFNLSAGTISTTYGSTYVGKCAISDAGNGWWRCSITGTNGASIANNLIDIGVTNASSAVGGASGNSIYLWGAQLELGTVATDYQRISDVNTEVIERFPSATLYQDPAGTTPVTTPGQTVGLMLDKSKGLALGAELVPTPYNGIGSGSWAVGTNSITRNGSAGGQASFGLSTTLDVSKSYRVTFTVSNLSGDTFYVRLSNGTTNQVTANGTYSVLLIPGGSTGTMTFAPWGGTAGQVTITNVTVRELPGNHATQSTLASRPIYGIEPVGGRRNLLLATDTLATQSLTVAAVAHTLAFTGTGTVTLTGASIAGPLIGTGASNRVSLTFTPTAASLTLTVVGSVTLAQLELGSTATAYQRVTTQYDVTEAGVASTSYLAFDGVDDGMVTGTITPGVDKAQVFAGVRKLSDAAIGVVAELSATAGTNAGSFVLSAPASAAANYFWGGRGSAAIVGITTASSYAAPITNVLTGIGDISGDLSSVRVNGVAAGQSTADQGTGNFLAYPLYIGRRGGATLPFKGNVYSLITRFGANLDTPTIANTETWVAQKTGISL